MSELARSGNGCRGASTAHVATTNPIVRSASPWGAAPGRSIAGSERMDSIVICVPGGGETWIGSILLGVAVLLGDRTERSRRPQATSKGWIAATGTGEVTSRTGTRK